MSSESSRLSHCTRTCADIIVTDLPCHSAPHLASILSCLLDSLTLGLATLSGVVTGLVFLSISFRLTGALCEL